MNNKVRGEMQSGCVTFHICRKFEFLVSQCSEATPKVGGYCHTSFVTKFIRFPAVQKFWKSVYDKVTDSQKVQTFWDTV